VPDLAQVPELDAGIMALGLVAVVAVAGGDRLEGDDQVLPSGGEVAGQVGVDRSRSKYTQGR
jgi:hypothetical protein